MVFGIKFFFSPEQPIHTLSHTDMNRVRRHLDFWDVASYDRVFDCIESHLQRTWKSFSIKSVDDIEAPPKENQKYVLVTCVFSDGQEAYYTITKSCEADCSLDVWVTDKKWQNQSMCLGDHLVWHTTHEPIPEELFNRAPEKTARIIDAGPS